jgi:hypothetical protein
MKRKIKIYSICILSAILVASCEKEIEFKGEITQPQVVINSFITPDSVVKVHVSESKFFLASGYTFENIGNADISVFVNDIFKEKMIYLNDGFYTSNIVPAVSDTIKLEVNVAGKNAVVCETTIEPKVEIISLDTTILITGQSPITRYNEFTFREDTIGFYMQYDCKFKLKIKDDVDKQNYYRLVVMTKFEDFQGGNQIQYYFTFDDIVSGNSSNNSIGPPTSLASNTYNVFSDELINGKEYPLSFYVSDYKSKPLPGYESDPNFKGDMKKEIFINLQQISKSYYLYLKSRSASNDSDIFFSEPIQIHNNIEGGIGILGSYTSNVLKIEL